MENLLLSMENLLLSMENLLLSMENLLLSMENLLLSAENLLLSTEDLLLSMENLLLSMEDSAVMCRGRRRGAACRLPISVHLFCTGGGVHPSIGRCVNRTHRFVYML
jgi:hypothetical protein